MEIVILTNTSNRKLKNLINLSGNSRKKTNKNLAKSNRRLDTILDEIQEENVEVVSASANISSITIVNKSNTCLPVQGILNQLHPLHYFYYDYVSDKNVSEPKIPNEQSTSDQFIHNLSTQEIFSNCVNEKELPEQSQNGNIKMSIANECVGF